MEGVFSGGCRCVLRFAFLLAVLCSSCSEKESDQSPKEPAGPGEEVTFSQSSVSCECFRYVDVTMNVLNLVTRNPFTKVSVSGHFHQLGQGNDLYVDGFCDSLDGSIFRIRFMPSKPGDYAYLVTYQHGDFVRVYNGSFKATEGKHRDILRVDANYPWHFVWEGSGKHLFLNGTTAFLLMGWDNEEVIHHCIDRLRDLEVNRIRVLLDGRTDHFWTEPIKPGNGFRSISIHGLPDGRRMSQIRTLITRVSIAPIGKNLNGC